MKIEEIEPGARSPPTEFSNFSFNSRKHSSGIRTDRAVARPSSKPVATRPIVDRQTPVKTLPPLAVGKKLESLNRESSSILKNVIGYIMEYFPVVVARWFQ